MWTLLALALVGLGGGLPQEAKLQSDLRLQLPISVHAKIVSLTDFADLLERETKAKVSVAPVDGDRKLTVLCVQRPASEVMEMVAETLFMSWSYDKRNDLWRLALQDKVRQEEAAVRMVEERQDRQIIRTALDSMQKWAGLAPEEQARESRAIRDRLGVAQQAEGPDAQQRLFDAQVQADLAKMLPCSGFGAAWKDRVEEAVTRLAAGESLLASSRPEDGLPLVPQSSVPATTFETPDPVGVVFMVRYLQSQSVLEGRGLLTGFKSGGMIAPFRVRLRPPVAESDLVKRLREWGEAQDTQVLRSEIDISDARIAKEGFLVPGFSVADHLEHLASGAHIPVVADAFRIACSAPLPFSANTVDAYLDFLKRPVGGMMPYQPGYFRTSRGWLMARSHEYWKKLESEIPERVLRPMEQTQEARPLKTWDYAVLAGKLTPPQSAWVGQMGAPVLLRFRQSPLALALPSLSMWSKLTPAARDAAASSKGVDMAELSGAEQIGFFQAVLESLWQRSVPDSFLSSLLTKSGPSLRLRYAETPGIGNLLGDSNVFLNPGVPPSLSNSVNVEFTYFDEKRSAYRVGYSLEAPRG